MPPKQQPESHPAIRECGLAAVLERAARLLFHLLDPALQLLHGLFDIRTCRQSFVRNKLPRFCVRSDTFAAANRCTTGRQTS